MFIPMLFISLVIAKVCTAPLVGFFDKLNQSAEEIDFIGKTGKVTLPIPVGGTGQIRLFVNDSYITLNAETSKEVTERIDYDEEVVIIEQDENKTIYTVEKI